MTKKELQALLLDQEVFKMELRAAKAQRDMLLDVLKLVMKERGHVHSHYQQHPWGQAYIKYCSTPAKITFQDNTSDTAKAINLDQSDASTTSLWQNLECPFTLSTDS